MEAVWNLCKVSLSHYNIPKQFMIQLPLEANLHQAKNVLTADKIFQQLQMYIRLRNVIIVSGMAEW